MKYPIKCSVFKLKDFCLKTDCRYYQEDDPENKCHYDEFQTKQKIIEDKERAKINAL